MSSALPSTHLPDAQELSAIQQLAAKFPFLFRHDDPRDRRTVAEVANLHMQHVRAELDQRTFEQRELITKRFIAAYGDRLVLECGPLDVKQFIRSHPAWKSGNMKYRVKADIQRCFNWAVENRLIRENPFRGLKIDAEKAVGRDMKPEEFQAIMRHSDPYFRRFLIAMKLTGARPGELISLKWEHVNWQRGLAILPTHKTRKKTGKPRVIVLVPNVLKLLTIIRRDQHGPAAVELRRILESSPDHRVRIRDVVGRMKELGFSYRAMYRAREIIGATYRRVGGWAEKGYTVYELPENPKTSMPPHGEHVFLCSKQRPWTRTALTHKLYRLRARLGIPSDCKVYSLRHFFCTWAVKNNVNLKALATLLGHQTTAMIERVYCHLDRDSDFLRDVAQQATALINHAPLPLPAPVDPQAWHELAKTSYPRVRAKPKPPPRPPRPAGLIDAEEMAYRAARWAIGHDPDLRLASDQKLYEYLLERPEWRDQLPPMPITFSRYLRKARKHYEGLTKRQNRRSLAGKAVQS